MLYRLPCGMKPVDLVLTVNLKMIQFAGGNKIFTLMPEFPKIEVTFSRTLRKLNLSNPQHNRGSAVE